MVSWSRRTGSPASGWSRVPSIALAFLFWILAYVLLNGWYAAFGHQFPSFWTHDFSKGGVLDTKARVGALAAIVGTLEQVGLATLVTTPLAVLAAVYLNEMPGLLAVPLRVVVDAMSGMPSIIAGLFIFIIWVVPRKLNGFSGLAAAMAISIIMMPTVIRTSEEVLRLVPGTLREAALALGSSERRMVLQRGPAYGTGGPGHRRDSRSCPRHWGDGSSTSYRRRQPPAQSVAFFRAAG